jgi:hypothetical protein
LLIIKMPVRRAGRDVPVPQDGPRIRCALFMTVHVGRIKEN